MGEIWVREFTGGLDTRRMPEVSPGGTLMEAEDGHITRGGDFEKRKVFKYLFDLPSNTRGLAKDNLGLVTFRQRTVSNSDQTNGTGNAAQNAPVALGGTMNLVRQQWLAVLSGQTIDYITSYDQNGRKIYLSAEFSNGSRSHYYNGRQVQSWVDAKARASFVVTDATLPKKSSGTIKFIDADVAGELTDIKIDGVSIITGAVITGFTTGNDIAEEVRSRINAHNSSPDYTATRSGNTVTITKVKAGASVEGKVINVSADERIEFSATTMKGGADLTVLDDVLVGGDSILQGKVEYTGGLAQFMRDIRDKINSSPGPYTAEYSTIEGVTLVAGTPGIEANGLDVEFEANSTFKTKPNAPVFKGGTGGELYQPGPFVKTIGSKMHSVSGTTEYFSGIQQPTKWNTDALGAGFIDMSAEDGQAGTLVAVAKYQSYVAVFADRCILIWFMDPDPALNKLAQVLNNTGTLFAQSVTQFGDQDLYYLNETGVRSLRARDSSSAASTADIGVLIDTIIAPKVKALTEPQKRRVIGLIEPSEGRFWQIIDNEIYVFSFFSGAKVSAWTHYNCVDDRGVAFAPDYAVVYDGIVYLRAGNSLFAYGGLTGDEYDDTSAIARIPYLNGDAPTKRKTWAAFDAAVEGEWYVEIGASPIRPDVTEYVATVTETSFDEGSIPMVGSSTHVSIRMSSQGDGPARLSSMVLHYDSVANED